MKLMTAIAILLASTCALAADNLVCSGHGSSQCYLIDNAGNKWDAQVKFTTDGSGDIFTLGDVASSDNLIGASNSSNRTLIDNSGRRWGASVCYTTDGNSNVIPVPSGGGSSSYTPAVPSNWPSPVPSTLPQAADDLAANKLNNPSMTTGSVPFASGSIFAQDNANFYFDESNHSLSVGPGPHPASSADLAISGQASDTKVGLSVFTTSTNNAVQISSQNAFSLAAEVASATNSPSINFERARGTIASKTQALAGDVLGSFVFNGYTGSADGSFAAGFGAVATENQASGHAGAEILFETTSNGSTTLVPRLVVGQDGIVEGFTDATTPLGSTSVRFADAHFSSVIQMGVQGSGSTPTCATANNGTLAITHLYVLCVCTGSAWVHTSDGSTSCTF